MKNRVNKLVTKRPRIDGTGLVALDIVTRPQGQEQPDFWAGGTCGNVLIGLCYLGWNAYPICRLDCGEATPRLMEDLASWGVGTDFVTILEDGSTPVIVEKIVYPERGEPYHTFSWRCPDCGSRFPGYKPVLSVTAESIISRPWAPEVFFFDRVSRAAIILAEACAKRGGVVVFEPSSCDGSSQFKEAWQVSHIVKYSHERISELPEDEHFHSPLVQIETLGQDGLRFKSRLPKAKSHGWHQMDAFNVGKLRDAAGSGDWCTIGILHQLTGKGLAGLKGISSSVLHAGLRFGQALAAWNCEFEGARGGMYSQSKREFEEHLSRIISRQPALRIRSPKESIPANADQLCICRMCQGSTRTSP